jgi:hypothetical protein
MGGGASVRVISDRKQEAGMIYLDLHLDWSPHKLVQTLYEWARRRGAQPVLLRLDAQGWPERVSLHFVRDRIYKYSFGNQYHQFEIDLPEAMRIVCDFYLKLRMAAALFLRVQRFAKAAEERGMSFSQAVEAWPCWEVGYADVLAIPGRERVMVLDPFWAMYEAGRWILQFREGERRSDVGIRVPDPIMRAPPRPPEELGIRWGSGKVLWEWDPQRFWVNIPRSEEGRVVITHLAHWLALPPEEIVRRIMRPTEDPLSDWYEILGLGSPYTRTNSLDALIFERGRVFRAFIVGKTVDRHHAEEVSKERAAELIAEQKLRLRRAAVYAAWAEASAERYHIDLQKWIHLDALATFGFAREEDVPSEALGAIKEKRSELLRLYETGLFVLEACRLSEGASTSF